MDFLNHVFISYAREDIEDAKRIYREIKNAGGQPWLDIENLLPGQDWEYEINRVIRGCSFFIAVISSHSVDKRGFVQKELYQALDVFNQLPPGNVYVIPVRLDDSEIPHERIEKIHRVDMFPSWDSGMDKILKTLNLNKSTNGFDNTGIPTVLSLSDQDIIRKIRENAERDHPNDFSTQKYVISKQIAAREKLKQYRKPGVSQDIIVTIISIAGNDHPFDFSTQLYVVDNQIKAWEKLNKYQHNGVPDDVIGTIFSSAKQDHPLDFSTQLYVIERQIKDWMELYNS